MNYCKSKECDRYVDMCCCECGVGDCKSRCELAECTDCDHRILKDEEQ